MVFCDWLPCLIRPDVEDLQDLLYDKNSRRCKQACDCQVLEIQLYTYDGRIFIRTWQHQWFPLPTLRMWLSLGSALTYGVVKMDDALRGNSWGACRSIRLHANIEMLTMIPAQCGASLARSEGLTANIRKATAVTATPNSSWSRATSRGKRQTLHLWPSSGAGLSSLFFWPSFSSEEHFCPFSMSPTFSVLSTLTVTVFGADEPVCLAPLHFPSCEGLLSP